MKETKVALITGSGKRVGACIAKTLHESGMHVVIHYQYSHKEAQTLCDMLNKKRPHSAITFQGDLQDKNVIVKLIEASLKMWGRLDVLINNAASFQSHSLSTLTLNEWENTLNNNLTAPFFLALAAASSLKKTKGCIINMIDIRATQPLRNYTPYCISKSGLVMTTKSLALEWAPDIRVNGIAPGVVLWPDINTNTDQKMQQKIIARTPLKRPGTPEDIAKAARFLIQDAPYITGQILQVDGGRSLDY